MNSNFHTHTKRCLHASGTEEDYVLAAINAGLSQLGFSDHAPFPDHDFGYRMAYAELDEYLAAIDGLKVKYGDRIQLFKGLEIEYFPEYDDYYRMLLEEKKLDYLALGEHFYRSADGGIKFISSASSTEDYLEYAENLCKGMETGFFRFAAHPDIMFLNDFAPDINAEKACDMITECAAGTQTILEYNANGYRRQRRPYPDGLRFPYPHPLFWEKAAKTDIRVIVGADAHNPEQVFDRVVQDALKTVSSMGLNLTNSIFETSGKENTT